ncbi:hypothetical protein [Tropicimonas sp. S265A]|uniref:hypothetical protein n=1 Tax=Tropicimonas sp. S265A TaxID=3415134 RepID=UPI003C7C6EA7
MFRIGMVFAVSACLAAPALGQESAIDGPLVVELNKLEQGEGDVCRAFFLFRNGTGRAFEGFEVSFALLDQGGVIDQLLTVDAAPLPVARTTLKLFEFPDVACGDIAELLLHEIGACRPQNGEELDCFEFMELQSKASAALVQ